MFFFGKIWRALFSCHHRLAIALFSTNWNICKGMTIHSKQKVIVKGVGFYESGHSHMRALIQDFTLKLKLFWGVRKSVFDIIILCPTL